MPDDSQMSLPAAGGPIPVRYVVLHHTAVVPEHFDLLIHFPEAKALVTLRILTPPETWPEVPPDAQRVPDHRLAYLTYEGPVSGGRGHVKRVATGVGEYVGAATEAAKCRLFGTLCCEIAIPDSTPKPKQTPPH
jgi:hypothetical protein